MSEICRDCGRKFDGNEVDLPNGSGELAVGVTDGVVVPEEGFYMGDGSPWEVVCCSCYAKRERKLQVHNELLEACKYVVKYHRENDSGEGELFGLDFVTTCIAAIEKAERTL